MRLNYDGLKGKKSGETLEFGSYPQSEVTDEKLIGALDDINKEWIAMRGTDKLTGAEKDCMKYADISYNGEKYRAVTFSLYTNGFGGYTDNEDSSSQYENGYFAGNVYYFKYEPIVWRILDNSGYVASDKILNSMSFQDPHSVSSDIDGKYFNSKSYENYANDWSTSTIREWLSCDFYNTAFSNDEKEVINTVPIEKFVNDTDNLFEAHQIDETENETIFMLSGIDYGVYVMNTERKERNPEENGTDYARCMGLKFIQKEYYIDNKPIVENTYPSWIINPKGSQISGAAYCCYGSINNMSGFEITFDTIGVVPVFKFK